MKNLIVLIVLLLGSQLRAQDSLWQKVYHSEYGYFPHASRATHNFEGGLVVAGQGDHTPTLYNIDSLGHLIWHRSLTNGTYYSDVIATSDSCFLTISHQDGNSSSRQVHCAKFSMLGDTIWTKSFESPNSFNYYTLPQIRETSDSCYLLSWNMSDASQQVIVKLNQFGEKLWDKILLDSVGYFHAGISALNNSTYYAFGNNENGDGVLSKIDSSGTLLWSKKYAGASFWDSEIIDQFIYLTYSQPKLGVMKVDMNGVIDWSRHFYFQPSNNDNYFATRPTMTFHFDSTLTIQTDRSFLSPVVKIDLSGNLISAREFYMYLSDVVARESGGSYVIGNGPYHGLKSLYGDHFGISKTDAMLQSGNCSDGLGNVSITQDSVIINSINITDSTGILSTQYNGTYYYFNMSDTLLCIPLYGNIQENTSLSVNVYPNIVENKVNFELSKFGTYHLTIIDLHGRTLKQKKFTGESTEVQLENLPSGIYLYNITGESDHVSGRLMKK